MTFSHDYGCHYTQRRLLRRIVVNRREQIRTAIEQIGELDLQSIGQGCEKKPIDLEPLEIQIQHDEAFDVEKVTDRFFKQYKEIFESVEGSIEGIENDEQKRLFTQSDPACGSGAYLLGMIHELLDLRACLFASNNLGTEKVYERKLEIIENNLLKSLDLRTLNVKNVITQEGSILPLVVQKSPEKRMGARGA